MSNSRSTSPALSFRVLGPLEVAVDDRPVQLGGLLRRAVVALLVVEGGRPVPEDALIESLWGDDPPAGARNSLQSHISRIRSGLVAAGCPDGDQRLFRTPGGYRIESSRAYLDLEQAEALLTSARRRSTVDANSIVRLLSRALDLWRGRPLEEFTTLPAWHGSSLAATQVRIDALENTIRDALFRAELESGGHARILPELLRIAALRPDHEPTHRLLALAFYRDGRPTHALSVLRRYRRDLAEHFGLDPSADLVRLEQSILQQDPELDLQPRTARPAESRPNPGTRTSQDAPLFGRRQDLTRLQDALAEARLVTVTGPGGVGKTRLVREAVAQSHLGDGTAGARETVFVELGSLPRGAAITASVAAALHIRGGSPVDAVLTDSLRDQDLLLILDNCEHVLDSTRALVAAVAGSAPAVTVLTTSRERLGLVDEHVLNLSSLSLPPPPNGGVAIAADELPTPGPDAPAVELFVERARQVRPEFALTQTTKPVVEVICRRLDGLPLAIELAAGQLRSVGVSDLLDRLGEPLDLLTSPARTSLRRVIDRSHELLDDDARELFENLSVFAGGFTLPAAEAVSAHPSRTAALVTRLVDTSLVVVGGEDGADGRWRYRMLETLRAYAAERLAVTGRQAEVESRFARWVAAFAETAEIELEGPGEAAYVDRVEAEMANIRAALRASAARGDVGTTARITVALASYAQAHGSSELWEWAKQLASDPQLAGHSHQVAVCAAAVQAHYLQGDLNEAERILAVARTIDDGASPWTWWCDAAANIVALYRGNYEAAEQLAISALRRAERAPLWRAILAGDIALARLYSADIEGARTAAIACTAIATEVASPTAVAWSRFVQGEVALNQGEMHAGDLLHEAVAVARSVKCSFVEGVAQVALLSATVRMGHHADAVRAFPDTIRHWQRTGMWVQQCTTLRILAELLAVLGADAAAATVLAALQRSPDVQAPALNASDGARADAQWEALSQRLTPSTLHLCTVRGTAMTRASLARYALTEALPEAALLTEGARQHQRAIDP